MDAAAMTVGDVGVGVMNISNHGTLTATDMIIGGTATGTGTVNIRNATMRVDSLSGSLGTGTFNIRGSKATITSNAMNLSTGNLSINTYVDSGRASTIYVNNALSDPVALGGTHHVAPDWGFSIINTDHFNIIEANSFTGAVMLTPQSQFTAAIVPGQVRTQAVQVTFDDSHPDMHHWDTYLEKYLFEEGGSYEGWLKMLNPGENYVGVIATFADYSNPRGGLNLTPEVSGMLVDYLNQSMGDSGVIWQMYQQNSFAVNGNFFGGVGYSYFGWDLNDFNTQHGTDIRLMSLEAPEPAAWAMMLAGCVEVLLLGRSRRAKK